MGLDLPGYQTIRVSGHNQCKLKHDTGMSSMNINTEFAAEWHHSDRYFQWLGSPSCAIGVDAN